MRLFQWSVMLAATALALGGGLAVRQQSAAGAPPCGACDSVNHPLHWHHAGCCCCPECGGCEPCGMMEGAWYWMRTPEQEKRVVMNLYNRYCVRCHGVDGRGVWDIPDVPNFANAVWQASRTDDQIARLTLEGRGACMPAFRGTLTLEEAWGMARYLRTFVPGTEVSPPDENAGPTPALTAPNGATKTEQRATGVRQPQIRPASANARLQRAR